MIQITNSKFPITVTETALLRVVAVREEDDDLTAEHGLRIACKGGGCSGYLYDLDFDDESRDTDHVKEFKVKDKIVKVMIDPKSLEILKGMTVDYVKTPFSEGFKFEAGDSVRRSCGCGASFSC